MLIVEARIIFDKQNLSYDLSTNNILRPAFNFGRDLLFSGNILVDQNIRVLKRNKWYEAIIELPTIQEEAYYHIQDLVDIGNTFYMHRASKVLGEGIILNFLFYKDNWKKRPFNILKLEHNIMLGEIRLKISVFLEIKW